MGLTFKVTDTREFENAPEGQYVGTVCKIIDKGTQPKMFKGVENGKGRQLQINFELADLRKPTNKMKSGEPFVINTSVNISSHKRSTFIKILSAALGTEAFNTALASRQELKIKDLLGKSIAFVVKHNKTDKATYVNIENSSIAELQPGVIAPKLFNKKEFLSLEGDEFNPSAYKELSEKQLEYISKSPEYLLCVGKTIEY